MTEPFGCEPSLIVVLLTGLLVCKPDEKAFVARLAREFEEYQPVVVRAAAMLWLCLGRQQAGVGAIPTVGPLGGGETPQLHQNFILARLAKIF